MKQKLLKLSLILGIFAVLMAISCTVNAATYGIYTYTTSGTEATITDCNTGASGSITIPKTINGYTVTSIGDSAFRNCTSLTTITIPDGVTSIGSSAFYNCTSLTTITIPDGVTSIGEYAFSGCTKLTTITIPDGVTNIGGYAFRNCTSLTTITIPDGVTSIGGFAFEYCTSLTTITIPDSVTSIGDGAFYNCTSLTTITIPDSVTSIGSSALEGCTCLTTITIPDSVTSIGYEVFYNCTSLTTITIPDSVTSIDDGAFSGCTSLKSVYYYGTEEEWDKISIGTSNSNLSNAERHYLRTILNKVSISGVKEVVIGDKAIEQSLSFATDKAAKYLTCTIKYPEYLEMTNLLGKDFALANINSTKVSDGYKYSTITCMYDYAGGLIPVNKEIIPFVMKFNVPQTASAGVANIEACDVVLLGDETYSFESGALQSISILPKLCERIEISGPQYIDEPSKYTASVYPEYTSNKSVVWSVSDEGIAKISEQGILTPVKNGRVTIYATAADGSGVYGSITVDVPAYAKIESLAIDGVWNKEFSADVREYTVYLKEDADFVNVKAVYNGGTLFANGMLLLPGVESSISIADSETVIEFIRKDVADMKDSMYTITFVKFEGTKTEVSADGKAFGILPVNLEEGSKIILSLYNGDKLVEFKTAVFEGESIHFETENAYTTAKVMAWESLNSLKAVCDSEMLK